MLVPALANASTPPTFAAALEALCDQGSLAGRGYASMLIATGFDNPEAFNTIDLQDVMASGISRGHAKTLLYRFHDSVNATPDAWRDFSPQVSPTVRDPETQVQSTTTPIAQEMDEENRHFGAELDLEFDALNLVLNSPDAAHALFQSIDVNKDGVIDADEFEASRALLYHVDQPAVQAADKADLIAAVDEASAAVTPSAAHNTPSAAHNTVSARHTQEMTQPEDQAPVLTDAEMQALTESQSEPPAQHEAPPDKSPPTRFMPSSRLTWKRIEASVKALEDAGFTVAVDLANRIDRDKLAVVYHDRLYINPPDTKKETIHDAKGETTHDTKGENKN